MQKDLWTKGLVLGIIGLFFGAGLLPSVFGDSVGDGIKKDDISKLTDSNPLNLLPNNPPTVPTTPEGISVGVPGEFYSFSTFSTDPDNDTIRYGWDMWGTREVDVWSDYVPNGTFVFMTRSYSTCTTYRIRVLAEDEHGAQSDYSPYKYFNITMPPNTPTTPSGPSSGFTKVSYSYSTSSNGPDLNDVKYGWDWNGDGSVDEWSALLPAYTTCHSSHSWSNPGTYRVKVKAQDEYGLESDWSTALTVTISSDNNPPNKPSTPSGLNSGTTGSPYSYYSSVIDPDGDQVYLMFDWGNGNNSGWYGPHNSGAIISRNYTWSIKGNYSIKVKAKDTAGLESLWSDPLPITMPCSYDKPIRQFLELLFQRFHNAFPILRQLLGY